MPENEPASGSRRLLAAFDHAVRVLLPDAAGPRAATTVRNVFLVLGLSVLGLVGTFAWNFATAEIMLRHEAEIVDKIAKEKGGPTPTPEPSPEPTPEPSPEPSPEPTAEPSPVDPGIWAVVKEVRPGYWEPAILLLEEGLSDDDVARYSSLETDDAGVTAIYAQLEAEASVVDHPVDAGTDGLSWRWTLTLNSTSETAVAVTDLQLKDLQCEPATATAAFDLPAQGDLENRPYLSYDLAHPTVPRVYEFEGVDRSRTWGEPFFEHKTVNLGGNEEGVGVTVEVIATDQDCTWSAFELSYQGPDGAGTYDITQDAGFAVRGVAPGANTFVLYPTDDRPDIYASPLW